VRFGQIVSEAPDRKVIHADTPCAPFDQVLCSSGRNINELLVEGAASPSLVASGGFDENSFAAPYSMRPQFVGLHRPPVPERNHTRGSAGGVERPCFHCRSLGQEMPGRVHMRSCVDTHGNRRQIAHVMCVE